MELVLFVAQAAISQLIRTLESYLNVKLLIRGTRRVSLTEEGKCLLPFIQAGFDNFAEGVVLLIEDANPNVLNVTVVESLSIRWLVPRLQLFQKRYPEMSVRLEIRFLPADRYVLVCHSSFLRPNIQPQDLYLIPLLEEND